MVQLGVTAVAGATGSTLTVTVTAPRDASVMQPGVYLVFVVSGGVPSVGSWIRLS